MKNRNNDIYVGMGFYYVKLLENLGGKRYEEKTIKIILYERGVMHARDKQCVCTRRKLNGFRGY